MAANQERTYLMIKPDGVQRGLVGEIIKRFETKGFKLVAMKFVQVMLLEFFLASLFVMPFFFSLLKKCCRSTTLIWRLAPSFLDLSSTWLLDQWWQWFGRV